MSQPLTGAELRQLKARAQRLKPVLHVGRGGLTPAFLASVDEALRLHELIKIKFANHKEEKKELVPVLVENSRSHLIMRVGNVAVLFRRRPAPEASSEVSAPQA